MQQVPPRDAFDMAAAEFRYVQMLNRLRAAYLTPVLRTGCEAPLHGQSLAGAAVYAWERGCGGDTADGGALLMRRCGPQTIHE